MSDIAIVDTNLLILLIVGSASRELIAKHQALSHYAVADFDLLRAILAEFSEFVLVPHIAVETYGHLRKIEPPARNDVLGAFKRLLQEAYEVPIPSVMAAQRSEFDALGLTDTIVLGLCCEGYESLRATLITSDEKLANSTLSLGGEAIYFDELRT